MSRMLFATFALVLLFLSATSPIAVHGSTASLATSSASFSVSASPRLLNITLGTSSQSVITVASINYTGPVNVTANSVPQGPIASLSLQTLNLVAGTSNTTTLTVSIPPSTTPRVYNVSVTASAGAVGSRITTVRVMVPDFTLTTGSATVTILYGGVTWAGLTVGSLYNLAGNVSLSTVVTPVGPTLSVTPSRVMLSAGQSSTANLTITGSKAGSFAVNVTGTSGLLAHSVIIKVLVQDFRISVDQIDSTVVVGYNETLTVRVKSLGGFTNPVNISAQPLPGLVVYPSTPVTPPGSLGLVVGGVIVGNYTLTIVGSSGPLVHSVFVTIHVANFSLVLGSSYLFVKAGVLANTTITMVGLNGFSGDVSLTVTPSTGLAYFLNTTRINGSTYALLSVSANVAGDYSATIQGSSVSLVLRSLLVKVVVTDFQVSPSDLSVPCDAGTSCAIRVNLAAINGFNDNVALSVSSSPSLTATLGTTLVRGSSSVTLMMSAPSAGNYSVIVMGASGSLSHSTGSIVLQVLDFTLLVGELPAPIQAGFSAVSGIKIISTNRFAGTVVLSATVSPVGPSVAINPKRLIVPSLGYGDAIMTVSIPEGVQPGTYNIMLTVSDASIQHSKILTLRVIAAPPSPPQDKVNAARAPDSPLLQALEVSAAALVGIGLSLVSRRYRFNWRVLTGWLNRRLGRSVFSRSGDGLLDDGPSNS